MTSVKFFSGSYPASGYTLGVQGSHSLTKQPIPFLYFSYLDKVQCYLNNMIFLKLDLDLNPDFTPYWVILKKLLYLFELLGNSPTYMLLPGPTQELEIFSISQKIF